MLRRFAYDYLPWYHLKRNSFFAGQFEKSLPTVYELIKHQFLLNVVPFVIREPVVDIFFQA